MHTSQRPLVLIASVALLALATSCSDDTGTGSGPEHAPSGSPPTAATTAAAEADQHRLLFQRTGTRRPHIAWVALDGSDESAPLTDFGDGAQMNPDWSPDGTRLVFVMTDGATDDLFVADAGATEATKLLDCVSPDLGPVPEQLDERVLGDLVGQAPVAHDVVDGARHPRELDPEDAVEVR